MYWAAFLLSAGLPLPERIFVHGYLTVDGEKISKSERSVEVAPVVAEVGCDALRWYLVRRFVPGTRLALGAPSLPRRSAE